MNTEELIQKIGEVKAQRVNYYDVIDSELLTLRKRVDLIEKRLKEVKV